MTDYEKLLEEADVTVRVLRASVPMVNADEAEMIRRLAAALREVMAENNKLRDTAALCEAIASAVKENERREGRDVDSLLAACEGKPTMREELDAALATLGKIRCVVGKAGTDDDVLDAVRSVPAQVPRSERRTGCPEGGR